MESSVTKSFEFLLQNLLSYDSDANIPQIKKAFDFANSAHKSIKRLSGEPYIMHPLSVAIILTELKMDDTSIIAALLHDVVEDTAHTIEEISSVFGAEVAFLVQSLTDLKSQTNAFDENATMIARATQLVTSAQKDVRVLIIRLADKLHNMRTIDGLTQERGDRFAQRVLKIYAPLADFIGGWKIKHELEDLAFKRLNTEAYSIITYKSAQLLKSPAMESAIKQITLHLKQQGIPVISIAPRAKGVYSTYKKLLRLNKADLVGESLSDALNQIVDKVIINIITPSVDNCYAAFHTIGDLFETIPNTFKDYITQTKGFGYRGLQIGVTLETDAEPITVEFQIKTQEMHEHNECGPASQLISKLQAFYANETMPDHQASTKTLTVWTKEAAAKQYRSSHMTNNIFVFTKDADIVILDKGSTLEDSAQKLTKDYELEGKSITVNGKPLEHRSQLNTGDIISISMDK